jgi:uncharacterized protein YaaQ
MSSAARHALTMKLIMATIQEYDAPGLLRECAARGWGVTQVATTGSVLRSGQMTLLIGVAASQARAVVRLIEEYCRVTVEPTEPDQSPGDETWHLPAPIESVMGGGSIAVVPVVRFVRL